MKKRTIKPHSDRRGTTLVIVIALLGLLAFTGLVFYTFASQERVSAEYFSEAAKTQFSEPDDVWPHMLEQLIVGPSDQFRGSKLWSPTRRFSMIRNLVGSDIYPYNGDGISVIYDAAGFPAVDSDGDRMITAADNGDQNLLEFVDSPVARNGVLARTTPEPDVDYTSADINNLFVAYNGWAIRDDGGGNSTQVRVIVPSFFRPQYMRTAEDRVLGDDGNLSRGATRDLGGVTAELRTNPFWPYAHEEVPGNTPNEVDITNSNRNTVQFQGRSFRPHPSDLAGVTENGTRVLRYITEDEAPSLGIGSGGFPFLPRDNLTGQPGGANGIRGDLGIWTGSEPEAYELDFDNDGDGIREGIVMDLQFPMQEFTDAGGNTRNYVVMYSMTVYDLDGLFNLNVHGNLAGLSRNVTLPAAVANGELSNNFLSRSHHGLGPNEVNPILGLRRDVSSLSADTAAHMVRHFGATPTDTLQQANAEWLWLLMGRGVYEVSGGVATQFEDLIGGRWGDKNLLFNSLERTTPRLLLSEMPRPGRAGNVYESVSTGPSFADRSAVDDNQNLREGDGIVNGAVVNRRPFGHPVSWSGLGRRTNVVPPVYNPATRQFDFPATTGLGMNPLEPILLRDETSTGSEQWPGYLRYGAVSGTTSIPPRYPFGPDETASGSNTAFGGTGDDLNVNPVFDELLEDPLETIFDQDLADRVNDGTATEGDLIALQWRDTRDRFNNANDTISEHLVNLAPHAFDLNSDNREMFTTISNNLRYIAMQRSERRMWEYTADTDGADNDGNGFGDGDRNVEFPPAFGNNISNGLPYSATDPFRPQVRRLLTNEIGENRDLVGALPLSTNHILDVERTNETPAEGTPQFLAFLQASGLRFRTLTEHPHITNTDADGTDAIDETNAITLGLSGFSGTNVVESVAEVPYPPTNFSQQEFWARRDRQQLARDIYVLLYTLGGAEQQTGGNNIRDYTGPNDPSGAQPLYNHEQLRRMAQFAVNMVDAMDTDNVITKFEYDKNLGDGWNLDDDPFSEETVPSTDPDVTSQGTFIEDSLSRGVVYGVEAQELAFSEVLGITSPEIAADDHDATLHDDTAGDRHHFFVELRNMRPTTVDLATTVSTDENTGIFRIVRYDRLNQADDNVPASGPTAAVTFSVDAGSVTGGQNFTVATASDNAVASSDFFFDFDLDNDFDLIAPDVNVAPPASAGEAATNPPNTDLDLIHVNHETNRFTLTNSSQDVVTVKGAFLESLMAYGGNQAMIDLSTDTEDAGGDFDSDSRLGFDLVLQRRANPHMPSLASTSGQTVDVNPWVEIDRIRVLFDDIGLEDGDVAADLPDRLDEARSEERASPLNDTGRQEFGTATTTNNRYNTIGADFNLAATNGSGGVEREQIWQPHFDRDFVSAGELLNVPVFGPNLTTQRLRYSQLAPQQQVENDSDTSAQGNISGAAAMFLWPDFDPNMNDTQNDNRWYRLFQFVEVPSRVHRMLGNYITQDRLPGKINLNMIRHFEVFAGIIDDPLFADVDMTDDDRDTGPFLRESTPRAVGADRWEQFLLERDGGVVQGVFDPTPDAPNSGDEQPRNFIMPAVPGSQPFRSYGHTAANANDNGLQDTMLRTSPLANTAGDNRHWLEVGDQMDHVNPMSESTTTVERYQVLSKIMNNTTTVSNTFVVFATAAYYEAVEDSDTGFVRVGGRLNIQSGDPVTTPAEEALPGARQQAIFVIDRSQAYNAFDPATGDFDWERLVRHTTIVE